MTEKKFYKNKITGKKCFIVKKYKSGVLGVPTYTVQYLYSGQQSCFFRRDFQRAFEEIKE